ncbi:MAG: TonB-dependent receptor [Proteobacteria bacterium]|nr:TonB-dependent receptor [Pseudomonadota bacterium]
MFRGANALQYGASNFGGAINLLTPTGEDSPGGSFRAEGGSFGHARAMASAGKSWLGGDAFAAATGLHQDGFRNNNTQNSLRFSGNAGLRSGDGEQRLSLSHTQTSAEIPGAISRAEIARAPRSANPANTNGRYERALDITRLGWRGAWRQGEQDYEAALFYGARSLENPVTVFIDSQAQDVGARGKITRRRERGQALIGTNIYYGTDNEHRFTNLGGMRGVPVVNRELEALTAEAYTQLEQAVYGDHLQGIAGLQASHARRGIRQSFPSRSRQQKNYTGISPRLGLRYDMPQGELFANVSRSFEPPTLSELSGGNAPGFAQLAAQRATTAELGMRWRQGAWQADAAYYHGWMRNEFITTNYPDGVSKTLNAKKSRRDGIELGLTSQLPRDVSLRAAYTFSRFQLQNDPLYGSHTLPGVPRHYLRSQLMQHIGALEFGPNVEWVPQGYPVDLANTLSTGSYAIYGLQATWSPLGAASLYLDARNLFNHRYIATTNLLPNTAGADGRYFYPGEGRALYAGLRLQW